MTSPTREILLTARELAAKLLKLLSQTVGFLASFSLRSKVTPPTGQTFSQTDEDLTVSIFRHDFEVCNNETGSFQL